MRAVQRCPRPESHHIENSSDWASRVDIVDVSGRTFHLRLVNNHDGEHQEKTGVSKHKGIIQVLTERAKLSNAESSHAPPSPRKSKHVNMSLEKMIKNRGNNWGTVPPHVRQLPNTYQQHQARLARSNPQLGTDGNVHRRSTRLH